MDEENILTSKISFLNISNTEDYYKEVEYCYDEFLEGNGRNRIKFINILKKRFKFDHQFLKGTEEEVEKLQIIENSTLDELVCLYAIYRYESNPIFYSINKTIKVENFMRDEMDLEDFKDLSKLEIEALKICQSNHNPITSRNLIYLSVCEVENKIYWYIGHTTMGILNRHYNIGSGFSSHAIQVSASALNYNKIWMLKRDDNLWTIEEKTIRKPDTVFAEANEVRNYILYTSLSNLLEVNISETYFLNHFLQFSDNNVICLNEKHINILKELQKATIKREID